jgi:mono/diheme cytochrome c family protein
MDMKWISVSMLAATAAAATATDEVSRGAAVYGDYCQNCHGEGARGLAAFEGDLATFRERLAGTANMPDMSGVLQEQEAAEVFAYLRSTQGK